MLTYEVLLFFQLFLMKKSRIVGHKIMKMKKSNFLKFRNFIISIFSTHVLPTTQTPISVSLSSKYQQSVYTAQVRCAFRRVSRVTSTTKEAKRRFLPSREPIVLPHRRRQAAQQISSRKVTAANQRLAPVSVAKAYQARRNRFLEHRHTRANEHRRSIRIA